MREFGITQTEIIRRARRTVFAAALFIELVLVLIDKSDLTNPIVSHFFRVTFALTLIVLITGRYTLKECAFIAAFIAVSVISYLATGRNELLRITVFVAAMKGIDYRLMLKLSFYVTLAGCILIVLLSVTGIFGELSLTQEYGGRAEAVTTRYVAGFGHPNAFHCMFFVLTLLWMYLYSSRLKIYAGVLILAANVVMFLLTNSRTGFIIGLVSVPLFFAAVRLKEKRWFYILAAAGVVCAVLFSVWAAASSQYCWDGTKLVDRIDHVLNGRIVQLYYGTEAHEGALSTWSLFSSPAADAYFDMGIVRLFYWYGIVPGIITVGVILYMVVQCYRRKDAAAAAWIALACLYTVIEAHLISVYIGRNALLLLLPGLLFYDTTEQGN